MIYFFYFTDVILTGAHFILVLVFLKINLRVYEIFYLYFTPWYGGTYNLISRNDKSFPFMWCSFFLFLVVPADFFFQKSDLPRLYKYFVQESVLFEPVNSFSICREPFFSYSFFIYLKIHLATLFATLWLLLFKRKEAAAC